MAIWDYPAELEELKKTNAGSEEGGSGNSENENEPPAASSAFIEWAEKNTNLNTALFVELQQVIQDKGIIYRKDYRACRFKLTSEITQLCELLAPLSPEKESNATWKAMVEDLNAELEFLRVKNLEDVRLQQERIDSVPEIPNFTVLGMPGFSYQKEFFPELIEIQTPGAKDTPDNADDYSDDSLPSYSYNTDSPIFGDVSKVGNLPYSPLTVTPGWSCAKSSKIGGFQVPSVQMNFQIPNLNVPNLNMGLGIPSLLLSLPPCIAQHIPPMFMPRMSVSLAQLGLGREMALIEKGIATVNNYATSLSSAVSRVNTTVNQVNTVIRDKVALVNGIASEINQAVTGATEIIDNLKALSEQDFSQIFNMGNVSFASGGSGPMDTGNLLNRAIGNGQSQTSNTLMTVRGSALDSTDPADIDEKSLKERMGDAVQKVKDKKNTIKESLLKAALADWDIVKW